jgi:hypothetical protein
MSKELTPSQIEQLYDFCYLQSVVHYDVQVELVDHLASAIEKIWEDRPQTTFDDALYEVNEEFGDHAGFVIIKQEKEQALRREYRKMLWKFISEFYRLPKIIFTAGISVAIYYGLKYTANDAWITVSLFVLSALFSSYFIYFFFPKYIKIKKEGYAFLFNEVLKNGVAFKTMSGIGVFLGLLPHLTHLSTVESIVFSLLFSLYLVLLFADCFVISIRMKEHFNQQFPQFLND